MAADGAEGRERPQGRLRTLSKAPAGGVEGRKCADLINQSAVP